MTEKEIKSVLYQAITFGVDSALDMYYQLSDNHWHTGTPTEAGWYLIKYKVGKNEERTCYRTEEYKLTPYCTFKNMEWQKIADEEESE